MAVRQIFSDGPGILPSGNGGDPSAATPFPSPVTAGWAEGTDERRASIIVQHYTGQARPLSRKQKDNIRRGFSGKVCRIWQKRFRSVSAQRTHPGGQAPQASAGGTRRAPFWAGTCAGQKHCSAGSVPAEGGRTQQLPSPNFGMSRGPGSQRSSPAPPASRTGTNPSGPIPNCSHFLLPVAVGLSHHAP